LSHAPPRATAPERARLHEDFVRLCEIPSPSGDERAMADAVAAELSAAGLEVDEDASGQETGSNAGNLLVRVEGPPGAPVVLLCAHLDTVPQAAPVEVVDDEGVFRNRNEGILGADNKAAVVVLLAVARRLAAQPAPVGVELLFTTAEETALRGARAFDRSRLRADFGYVMDHATPIGELVTASPTFYRIDARFHGAAAHAGIRPEDGRNAIAAAGAALARMKLGRLDAETTANAGLISGGTAVNVVAERCTVVLEGRSLDDARAGEVVSAMVDACTEAASEAECDVEASVERLFRAYRLARTHPAVEAAARALGAHGIEPDHISTGGGSDANVFVEEGLPVVNMANGTQHNHEPGESVSRHALETMLDVTLTLLAESARPS